MTAAVSAAEQELEQLAAELPRLAEREPALSGFFPAGARLVLARAPGRLDVMGGIADYSGALVLEQPIREAALVAVAHSDDASIRVASLGPDGPRLASFPARELWQASASYAAAGAYFQRDCPEPERWAAYLAGTLAALCSELGVSGSGGLCILLQSGVPEGKGVSSSAAIEVVTLRALCELFGVSLSGEQLALACQRVENLVVGAPCGVMDQMTSACGQESRLLALLCQPAIVRGFVALPEGVALFGVDSGLRHAVSGADYGQVRAAAFMGLSILAQRLGARAVPVAPGRVLLEDDPLGGYLARLSPSELSPELVAALPETLSGAEFLRRFQGISDVVTRVEPGVSYAVRAATLHPIYEHARVTEFAERLPGAASASELGELGELMYGSHRSYSRCGLGSSGTDRLAELARAAGPDEGVFGAKITGGGSGGTVALLARPDALVAIRRLAARYTAETGQIARIFAGSSPGALGTPVARLGLG